MPRTTTLTIWYVYVLEGLKDGNRYVGFTGNPKQRMRMHQMGKAKSTKLRRPLRLIYLEGSLSKTDALRRERYLKTTNGGRFLKRRLVHYYSSKL